MVDNFDEIWQRIAKIPLFGKAGEAMPTEAELAKAVRGAAGLLPPVYQDTYVAPLEAALPRLAAAASRGGASTVETLTAAIYQHQTGDALSAPLERFLAVVSDLYRSFLDRDKRRNIGVQLTETLPPLAMFQNDGSQGPFTIPVDQVAALVGGRVGVVSMPATYANDPIIWAALAHETGGHDVTHADAGLLDELAAGIATAFAGSANNPAISQADLTDLWSYWIDEASADVYGLLNVGPIFATNLAFFFVALNKVGGGTAQLRMQSSYDPNDPQQLLDPHPTDILRLHLAIGVIDALTGLSAATRARYIADLEALAAKLASGDSVELVGNIPVAGSNSIRPLQVTAPLGFMQTAARSVGGYIATARLRTLSGNSIQAIETWDESDETQATTVRDAALAGKDIVKLGDDAQLLAGITLALLRQPDQYDGLTMKLAAGLDQSFKSDPIWGMPPIGAIWIRYPEKLVLR